MRPRLGDRNLVNRLKKVVLPAPIGPRSAWIVPSATSRWTFLTARKPANSLVSFSVLRIGSPLNAGSSLGIPFGGLSILSRRDYGQNAPINKTQSGRSRDTFAEHREPVAQ